MFVHERTTMTAVSARSPPQCATDEGRARTPAHGDAQVRHARSLDVLQLSGERAHTVYTVRRQSRPVPVGMPSVRFTGVPSSPSPVPNEIFARSTSRCNCHPNAYSALGLAEEMVGSARGGADRRFTVTLGRRGRAAVAVPPTRRFSASSRTPSNSSTQFGIGVTRVCPTPWSGVGHERPVVVVERHVCFAARTASQLRTYQTVRCPSCPLTMSSDALLLDHLVHVHGWSIERSSAATTSDAVAEDRPTLVVARRRPIMATRTPSCRSSSACLPVRTRPSSVYRARPVERASKALGANQQLALNCRVRPRIIHRQVRRISSHTLKCAKLKSLPKHRI